MPESVKEIVLACSKLAAVPFNGVLLNFYEGADRIGPHRDQAAALVGGSPIATLSVGGSRVFRITPHKSSGARQRRDLPLHHGDLLIMSAEMNHAYTHEVLKPALRDAGRMREPRVSITMRVFK
jgi:alkylated DNA repair dioxygenase AlkB